MMRSAKTVVCSALIFYSIGLAGALFIPEELPTLLSFIYTNIPPIFKGTDSRLGVGFRVGPNADFQVQVELGPQTRTNPLGPDAEAANKKRQVDELQAPPVPRRKKVKKVKKPTDELGKPLGWLQTWKSTVGNMQSEEEELSADPEPVMDLDTVMHLRQLYNKHENDNESR